jgi:hypothetical protein
MWGLTYNRTASDSGELSLLVTGSIANVYSAAGRPEVTNRCIAVRRGGVEES